MSLRVVHQFEVAVVSRVGGSNVSPPSRDRTRNVSTNDTAGPISWTRSMNSGAMCTSHVVPMAFSWLS